MCDVCAQHCAQTVMNNTAQNSCDIISLINTYLSNFQKEVEM